MLVKQVFYPLSSRPNLTYIMTFKGSVATHTLTSEDLTDGLMERMFPHQPPPFADLPK